MYIHILLKGVFTTWFFLLLVKSFSPFFNTFGAQSFKSPGIIFTNQIVSLIS